MVQYKKSPETQSRIGHALDLHHALRVFALFGPVDILQVVAAQRDTIQHQEAMLLTQFMTLFPLAFIAQVVVETVKTLVSQAVNWLRTCITPGRTIVSSVLLLVKENLEKIVT